MSDEPRVECYDSLEGQVALVTGATRGIGAVIAAELAALGATVYAGARDPDDVTDDAVRPVELDVTEEPQVEAAIDRIAAELGRLDVLVNNAGVFPGSGPLHDLASEDVEHTLSVNLQGAMLVAKHALPPLLERDGGRVVNVSSSMAQFADGQMDGGGPAYRTSKVGLNGLTAYLHAEYGDVGLIANAASPGWVRTDMGGPNADRSPEEGADTPVWLSRFRPGSPDGLFWKDREVIEW